MANEAVRVQQLSDRFFEATVADGTGIEKGTLMKFSADPNTVIASSADGDKFAGILLEEKTASDGQTRVSLARHGVYDIKCTAGGCTAFAMVKISGANLIEDADDDTVANAGEVVGMALETGAANEVVNVLLCGSM